jgi:hypothetical protein
VETLLALTRQTAIDEITSYLENADGDKVLEVHQLLMPDLDGMEYDEYLDGFVPSDQRSRLRVVEASGMEDAAPVEDQ